MSLANCTATHSLGGCGRGRRGFSIKHFFRCFPAHQLEYPLYYELVSCRQGINLGKELMEVAGQAMRANLTTLAPRTLPLPEKLHYIRSLFVREVSATYFALLMEVCPPCLVFLQSSALVHSMMRRASVCVFGVHVVRIYIVQHVQLSSSGQCSRFPRVCRPWQAFDLAVG
jgi:hypothetical protein